MKDNFAALILTLILLVCVITTAFLSYSHVNQVGRVQRLQIEMNLANRNLALMNGLGTAAKNYSEKHPAIDPIIERAIKANAAAAARQPAVGTNGK